MVELSRAECEAALSNYTERLSPAVSNGPNSTVISGDVECPDGGRRALERQRRAMPAG
jgi:hypothetical protein